MEALIRLVPFAGTKHSTLAVNALAAKVLKNPNMLEHGIESTLRGRSSGRIGTFYLMGKGRRMRLENSRSREVRAIAMRRRRAVRGGAGRRNNPMVSDD